MQYAEWYAFARDVRINYEGWEANPILIENLRRAYANDAVSFYLKDIVLEPFPRVDLIIAVMCFSICR